MAPNSVPQSETQILLAEPDPTIAASAQRVLERRGFRVTLASDGEQALERFDPQFHVVIASVSLPKRDGLAVMREIIARAQYTQIIFLTDASAVSAAMMGLQEGAFAYILTPIADYLQLTHAVEMALELYRLRRDLAILPSAASPPKQDVRSLNQLAETIRRAQPQVEMLESILKSAGQIFGASKAVVFLADASQNLQMVGGLGNKAQAAAARDFIHVVGEEFAWRVAKERRTLTAISPNKKFTHVGAPLIARDRLVGVLIVYDIVPGRADAERLGWLQMYATQVAAAVELARLDEENARLVPIDALTGALKENIFLEIAEREFRRSWRFNESLSVIHVQVDGLTEYFKRSQELGNRVLRTVADICRQSVRNIDLVARGKDDSFTLLLLVTDSAGAHSVAERIARAVRELLPDESEEAFRISVQLGVTTYPHEGCASLMDLLEIARSAHGKTGEPGQNLIAHA